jgi:hypothetical protein
MFPLPKIQRKNSYRDFRATLTTPGFGSGAPAH